MSQTLPNADVSPRPAKVMEPNTPSAARSLLSLLFETLSDWIAFVHLGYGKDPMLQRPMLRTCQPVAVLLLGRAAICELEHCGAVTR